MTAIPIIPDIVLPPEADSIPTNTQPKSSTSDDFQELMQAIDLPSENVDTLPKPQKKPVVEEKKPIVTDMTDTNAALQSSMQIQMQQQALVPNEKTLRVNANITSEFSTAVSSDKATDQSTQFKQQIESTANTKNELATQLNTQTQKPDISQLLTSKSDELPQQLDKSTQISKLDLSKVLSEMKSENQQVTSSTPILPQDVKNKVVDIPEVMQSIDAKDANMKILKKQQLIDSTQVANKAVKKAFSIDMHLPEITNNSKVADEVIANTTTNQSVVFEKLTSEQENKYFQAISQLGNAVNASTTQQYKVNLPANTTNMTQQANESGYINESGTPDVHFNVELLPQTIDSLAKQTYDAKIRIYPPELGHITASLKIDRNTAELTIIAQNDHVKSIIESNMPQLRQNFQQADITLSSVQVQTATSGNKDTSDNNQQGNNPIFGQQRDELGNKQLSDQKQGNKPNSLVDTYA